ncbi:MAG TPA: hypothetical protein VMZ50_08935 [Phycisphaerae bacterium]|nr:hypothetical protein [Phycisphaerae bacterium]
MTRLWRWTCRRCAHDTVADAAGPAPCVKCGSHSFERLGRVASSPREGALAEQADRIRRHLADHGEDGGRPWH